MGRYGADMARASALDNVRSLSSPVNDLGGRWLLHPATMQAGAAAGYANPFAWYVAGRGGVLGDVDADVVGAAFGFFSPDAVRAMWTEGVAVEGARACADRYTAACAQWGRDHLAGADGLDVLTELGRRWADSVSACGLSLFAGWRAQPEPSDAEGRAALCLHVLRELRGSVHICATTAAGLSPLDALLTDPSGGAARAAMFGWPEPHPDVSHLADARRVADTATDDVLAAQLDAALTAAEQSDLVSVVTALRAHVDAAAG